MAVLSIAGYALVKGTKGDADKQDDSYSSASNAEEGGPPVVPTKTHAPLPKTPSAHNAL